MAAQGIQTSAHVCSLSFTNTTLISNALLGTLPVGQRQRTSDTFR